MFDSSSLEMARLIQALVVDGVGKHTDAIKFAETEEIAQEREQEQEQEHGRSFDEL
jgi:hypothetical protein